MMFEKQGLHVFLLCILLVGVAWVSRLPGVLDGSYGGISTSTWLWWSIAVPVVHQVWVLLCWRLELHHQGLSSQLGEWGFRIYAIGFAVASFLRFFTIIGLGLANRGTLEISQTVLNVLAVILSVPMVYLFYSVARFFSFKRALGADHFDEAYRAKSLEHRGIFRFTRNGMYIYGFFTIWIPGLLFASKAALLSAAFSHIYIWVHYHCIELPDMNRIYGRVGLPQAD
jgi:hypothetical protein